MAVFKYKMQSILEVKEKVETQAKQDFAAAQLKLNEELNHLEEIRKRREEYVAEGIRLRNTDIDIVAINANKRAVELMDEFEKQQLLQVNVAQKEIDAASYKMMEARAQTKTYEKLKEKAFDEFVAEENHKEGKQIDELNSFRFTGN